MAWCALNTGASSTSTELGSKVLASMREHAHAQVLNLCLHCLLARNTSSAVFTVSSSDRETGCWSWNNDGEQVAALLNKWLDDWG